MTVVLVLLGWLALVALLLLFLKAINRTEDRD